MWEDLTMVIVMTTAKTTTNGQRLMTSVVHENYNKVFPFFFILYVADFHAKKGDKGKE